MSIGGDMLNQIKLISIISVFMFCSSISLGYGSDFRGSNWGATIKEVKAQEKSKLIDADRDSLMYSCFINNLNSDIIYLFTDGKLISAGYVIHESHSNKNLYIGDYDGINDLFTKKYGKPSANIIDWKNDLYKNNKKDYGMAVSMGHLDFKTAWISNGTFITHRLQGDNFKISHTIHYYDEKNMPKLSKQLENAELDKL